jgi:hypothetical protein
MRILIDRNLERHAVTHTTRTTPQPVKWGPLQLDVPVVQRCHDEPREDESFLREQLPYLVSLCCAAKERKLEFCTSRELEEEARRQPVSKQGNLGIDWFAGVEMTNVPCPVDRFSLMSGTIGPDFDFTKVLREAYLSVDAIALWNKGLFDPDPDTQKSKQLDFFRWIIHPRFVHLKTTLGGAQLADAFHLWTAEEAHLDVFLTMDKKFLNNVRNRLKAIGFAVSVMAPKELCDQIALLPSDIDRLAAEINPFA